MINVSIETTKRGGNRRPSPRRSNLDEYEIKIEKHGFFGSRLVVNGKGSHTSDDFKSSPAYDEELSVSLTRPDLVKILNEALKGHMICISDFEIFASITSHLVEAQNHLATIARIIESDSNQISGSDRANEVIQEYKTKATK